MSITPCPYTEPSINAPENGSVALQPCDTGFVSMWPVITTRRPGPKLHLADRVGPPRQHRLQRDVGEPRHPHGGGQELRQRALVAQHAGDPAHLLHEPHRAVEVDVRERPLGDLGDSRSDVHRPFLRYQISDAISGSRRRQPRRPAHTGEVAASPARGLP